jgi:alpha-tubulin suppressor-like RCC1 family protein
MLATGGRHTCAVVLNNPGGSNAGAVYCWGDNTFGQLGNSWTKESSVPVNVAGLP